MNTTPRLAVIMGLALPACPVHGGLPAPAGASLWPSAHSTFATEAT
jgi:hypothetical protein